MFSCIYMINPVEKNHLSRNLFTPLQRIHFKMNFVMLPKRQVKTHIYATYSLVVFLFFGGGGNQYSIGGLINNKELISFQLT